MRQLIAECPAIAGTHDEHRDAEGEVAPPFQELLGYLEQIGRDEFSRRWIQAQRVLRENGLAYGGYAKSAQQRPWELDPIPVVLQARDWDRLKQAINQRAKLLNLLVQDVYGPQKMIHDGVIPPSLVHCDPGFYRHYIDHARTESPWLQLYAADIARAPNGTWWVLADRTEAPSGLGYALEHRIVMSRLLPEAFRGCNIKRLAPFFVAMQNSMSRLSDRHRDNPRVALLSDGPENPHHLEDAYLARYLGYTLVEDSDLAVRSSRTSLKTLGGLQPIDVIFRHQNSVDSDPLLHDSTRGVAGLNQSAKKRKVAISNRLGSGLVESPAYMAYLPRLCEAFLAEDLMIPNVATWWCGDEDGMDYVLANLDSLVIQPAFRRRGRSQGAREALCSRSNRELAALIRENPRGYVGQERVERSSVVTWRDPPEAARLALRCYAVASGPDFHVLDGGLGRVTATNDQLEITIRQGEKSKDVWIRSEDPVRLVTLLDRPGSAQEVRRTGADLPSRVADDLFWLGRRLERAENHAHLVNVTLSRLSGDTPHEELELPMLLRCLAAEGLVETGYGVAEMRDSLPDIEQALPGYVLDGAQPDSLRSGIDQVVRLGARLRDRLSVQASRIIQHLGDGLGYTSLHSVTAADLLEITDDLMMHLAAISGVVRESMTRSQVFRFLDLGRRIERSLQLITTLREGLLGREAPSKLVLIAILELANSLMTYRSRYLANIHATGTADLLITDEVNPRSLAYQFVRMQRYINELPLQDREVGYTPEQRVVMNLVTRARMFELADDNQLASKNLSELEEWESQITQLSRMISHRYLVHAAPPVQLTDIDSR